MTAPNYSTHPASVRSRLREERKRQGLVLLSIWVPSAVHDACIAAVQDALNKHEGEKG